MGGERGVLGRGAGVLPGAPPAALAVGAKGRDMIWARRHPFDQVCGQPPGLGGDDAHVDHIARGAAPEEDQPSIGGAAERLSSGGETIHGQAQTIPGCAHGPLNLR